MKLKATVIVKFLTRAQTIQRRVTNNWIILLFLRSAIQSFWKKKYVDEKFRPFLVQISRDSKG